MKPAMVETEFSSGVRMHVGVVLRLAVPSTNLVSGALAATTTKTLGKTTR